MSYKNKNKKLQNFWTDMLRTIRLSVPFDRKISSVEWSTFIIYVFTKNLTVIFMNVEKCKSLLRSTLVIKLKVKKLVFCKVNLYENIKVISNAINAIEELINNKKKKDN